MKVAVFGAGTMGRGIAQVFAAKDHTVLMYASSPASAQRHKDTLSKSLQKRVDKGKMAQDLNGIISIFSFICPQQRCSRCKQTARRWRWKCRA